MPPPREAHRIDAHPTWRKHRPLVPLPASLVKAQEALGLPHTGFPIGFRFIRRIGGPEIMLGFENRIWINVTPEPRPKSFKDARKWCAWFASQHGFTSKEIPW